MMDCSINFAIFRKTEDHTSLWWWIAFPREIVRLCKLRVLLWETNEPMGSKSSSCSLCAIFVSNGWVPANAVGHLQNPEIYCTSEKATNILKGYHLVHCIKKQTWTGLRLKLSVRLLHRSNDKSLIFELKKSIWISKDLELLV